jgi:hypothetical protein
MQVYERWHCVPTRVIAHGMELQNVVVIPVVTISPSRICSHADRTAQWPQMPRETPCEDQTTEFSAT